MSRLRGEPTPESKLKLRVEAFGSGVVVVPQFDVDIHRTTCKELFDCIELSFTDTKGDATPCLRLICGSTDTLTVENRNRLIAEVLDIAHYKVVHVVVAAPEWERWQSECLMQARRSMNGARWIRIKSGWGTTDDQLRKWSHVKVDKRNSIIALMLAVCSVCGKCEH